MPNVNYIKTTIRLTETANRLAKEMAEEEDLPLQKIINDAVISYVTRPKKKVTLRDLATKNLGLRVKKLDRSLIYSND